MPNFSSLLQIPAELWGSKVYPQNLPSSIDAKIATLPNNISKKTCPVCLILISPRDLTPYYRNIWFPDMWVFRRKYFGGLLLGKIA